MILENSESYREGIDAVRDFGAFLGRIIGGPLEQAGGIVEDKIRYIRLERQLRLQNRFFQVLRERGLSGPTRTLPLKLAIPLLQAATMEENDDLQDLWANLLANSADADSGVEARRTFIDILSSFTTLDALVFDRIYSIPERHQNEEIWTLCLPDKVTLEQPNVESSRPTADVELSLGNLIRNGCLNSAVAWGGVQITSVVNQTVLGRYLHKACSRNPVRENV